jgi:MoxR-like ATPase
VLDPRTRELIFRPGPVFTQLLLVDEINRATPKTQAALLEVMEERAVTVEGRTHALEEPFQVLATMNPVDHHGTFPLPAAQVDRFLFALQIGYPSPDDEVRVLERHLGGSPLASITPVLGQERLVDWCRTASAIHVAPAVKRAAVDYVNALRHEGGGLQPVSPRATLAWVRAAQARAMFEGRDFASADDLLEVAPDVLRHRLATDPETVRERLRAVPVGAAEPRRDGGAA